MNSPIPTVIVTPSTPCFSLDAHCPSSPSPSSGPSSSSSSSSSSGPRARIRAIRRHTHPLFPVDEPDEYEDDSGMPHADLLTPLRYARPHAHGGHGRKRRTGGTTIPFVVFVLAVLSLVLASALIPRHLENELHLSAFARSRPLARRSRTGPPTSRIEWGPGHTLRSIESLARRNGRSATEDSEVDVDRPSSKLGNRGPVSAEAWRAYRERRAAGAGAGTAIAPDAGMAGMELWDFH